MRAISGSNLAVLGRHFATHAYLEVDGVQVNDVLGWNPFMRGTWDHDIDSPVGNGQIAVDLGSTRIGTTSPWRSTSVLLDGRPLFDVGRNLSLWTATTERNAQPTSIDWHRVLDSRIDDYDPAASSDDVLAINVRDRLCDVLDTWIEDPVTGVTGNVDLVLVSLLGIAFPGGTSPFTLTTSPSPGPSFAVASYTQDIGSCLLALRQIVLQTGWDLRGLFNVGGLGLDEWGLVLLDPRRSETTPAYSFPAWRYDLPSRMAVSRNSVRNRIRVIPNTATRTAQFVFDGDSINRYGRRFMELEEGLSSHIDSDAEGLALANYALSDLKDPKAEWVVPMPYWYAAEIHDRYEFQPAGGAPHFDTATTLAVSGFKHTLENGEGKTELRLRRNAAAANREWRGIRPRSIYASALAPAGPARERAVWLQTSA